MRKTTKLLQFILISFLLPLVALFLQIKITNHNVKLVLYGIQASSPSIAAIIVLIFSHEVGKHFKRIFQKGHILAAIVIPFLIASMTMLISKSANCFVFGKVFSFSAITMTKWLILLWALIAEELGWRGYLEPLLRELRIKQSILPGIVGIIWGLWHYHYFIQGKLDVPILLFSAGCIIESYIYSILVSRTKTVLSAMVYHFSWNLMLNILMLAPSDNEGSIFPYALVVILETLGLIIYVLIKNGRHLTDVNYSCFREDS